MLSCVEEVEIGIVFLERKIIFNAHGCGVDLVKRDFANLIIIC